MNFKSLSLRYKFLTIVGVLLSASIFSYLFIAVNLFNDDKRAYIYDSNASLTNSLASESSTVILTSIEAMETMSGLIKSSNTNQNQNFARKIFWMNENLVYIEVYDAIEYFSKNSPRSLFTDAKANYLEPYNIGTTFYKDALKAGAVDKNLLKKQKYLIYQTNYEGAPILTIASVTNSESGKSDDVVAVAHLRQDKLLAIFSRTDLYHTYLVGTDGRILIENKASKSKDFSSTDLIENISNQKIKAGVLSYTKEGAEFILSYSKIDKLGVAILSEISSDLAFLASKRLVEKSVQFALLIFVIALIVSVVFTKQITAALSLLYKGTLKIGEGDFSSKVDVQTDDEIGHLASSFNIMSDKIVSLLEDEKKKAGLEKELATAQTVQNTFFPDETKKSGPITLSGKYQPATQCGGDWWGHVEGPNGVHYVFIADAMGHGVSAALVTAMAYSSCQTLAELIKTGSIASDSPGQILEKFNTVLYNAVRGKISMTFFAMKIDTRAGKITYANAGHNFPILFPLNENDERAGRVVKSFKKISDRPPVNLSLKGTPLGVMPHCTFEEAEMELVAGDKFFLFTDGIIECSNPQGEVWGRKTLTKNVLEMIDLDASKIQETIFSKASEFFDGNPIDDDLTIVVIEVDKAYSKSQIHKAS